ncbi:MAG: hypothetical protein ACREJ3_09865, partial [Polyangiaceae bacterium]
MNHRWVARWAIRVFAFTAPALDAYGCSSADGTPATSSLADAASEDGGIPDATLGDVVASADAGREGAIGDALEAVDAPPDAPPSDADTGADADADASPCTLDPSGEPTDLRCTGLYSDWASKTLAPDVRSYDPGLHLWSDGAVKSRWVVLPPGTKIDTSNMDEWTFPVGTKFWKQFVVNGKFIETRLLHKLGPISWYPTTYAWSADNSTATELTTGELNANDAGYEIPSQAKCIKCHQGRIDYVLGFEAVGLSSPGASGVTMTSLVAQGLLTSPPTAPITIPGTPVEAAALGYLHANCGNACHNRGNGIAGSTGFFMRLNVADLGRVQTTDAYTTWWYVMTSGFHQVPNRITQ